MSCSYCIVRTYCYLAVHDWANKFNWLIGQWFTCFFIPELRAESTRVLCLLGVLHNHSCLQRVEYWFQRYDFGGVCWGRNATHLKTRFSQVAVDLFTNRRVDGNTMKFGFWDMMWLKSVARGLHNNVVNCGFMMWFGWHLSWTKSNTSQNSRSTQPVAYPGF